MSYKVKPENIDDEAFEAMSGDYWADFGMGKAEMADIINAAIEAGLVSPPCWAVTRPGSQITWGPLTLDQAKRMVLSGEKIEHWKGQTS